jgi:hypothetical protein
MKAVKDFKANTGNYKQVLEKLAEAGSTNSQVVQKALEAFERTGAGGQQINQWVAKAKTNIDNKAGSGQKSDQTATETEAKPEEVKKAKTKFGGKITTNTAITGNSNAKDTIGDTTNFKSGKFAGDKAKILKDATKKSQWEGITKAIIDEIKNSSPGKKFTPAQLKTIIDDDKLYDIMQEAVNGESGIVELLK